MGTLPLVWLGARLGGPEGVVLGQSASFALFSLVALALCRRAAPASQAGGGCRRTGHRRLDFIIGTRYDRG